ncbi:MAG: hypothetical protein NVSMB52_15090 [Chloroflexota bacterium]
MVDCDLESTMHNFSKLRTILAVLLLIPAVLPSAVQARSRHASPQRLIVVLDPGHGGPLHFGGESGAADASGTLLEKNMSLAVAKLAKRDLEALGYRVYLTRTRDLPVNTPPRDLNHDKKIDNVDEFNARTLFANRHHANIFVSIHFDGNNDSSIHGTHGYYCPARPFWEKSKRLTTFITGSISSTLTRAGYPDPNNGVQTDVADVVPQTRADYPWFLVLGPSRHHWLTATSMPGALVETLYMSIPRDAAALRKPSILAAIARGYTTGIRTYFDGHIYK